MGGCWRSHRYPSVGRVRADEFAALACSISVAAHLPAARSPPYVRWRADPVRRCRLAQPWAGRCCRGPSGAQAAQPLRGPRPRSPGRAPVTHLLIDTSVVITWFHAEGESAEPPAAARWCHARTTRTTPAPGSSAACRGRRAVCTIRRQDDQECTQPPTACGCRPSSPLCARCGPVPGAGTSGHHHDDPI